MTVKKVEVEVSEATFEVVDALVALAVKIKSQLDDGFQMSQDLVVIAAEVFALQDKLSQLSMLPSEAKESPSAFAMALMTAGAPLADLFKSKDKPI